MDIPASARKARYDLGYEMPTLRALAALKVLESYYWRMGLFDAYKRLECASHLALWYMQSL